MTQVDFLDYRQVVRYTLLIAIMLVAGSVLKNAFPVLILGLLLYFAATKNLFKTIEFFLIWFAISGFFIGQGYITSSLLSTYIAKPGFLLFIILLAFIKEIPAETLRANYIQMWLLFLVIVLFGAIFQDQSPFVIISISFFFMACILLQINGLSTYQYYSLLNLIIAIAIIQTFVSFLQVSQLITPPMRMMEDGSGGEFLWEAGLDDVASGTFGASSSHLTSWYAALISLLLLITWAATQKPKYLIILSLVFLQFATVDSKIILGVTAIMLVFVLISFFKERRVFNLNIRRYASILLLIAIGAFGFYKAWNTYYEYFSSQTGSVERADLSAIYKNEMSESAFAMTDNLGDWGKIRGFENVFNDFTNDPMQLIWGYGIQGYDFNGKAGEILRQDTPMMQMNNLTNSNSGLITHFATFGVIGFLLFLTSLIMWYCYNKKHLRNEFDIVGNMILKIFSIFSLVAAFLYPILITSIPIIFFGIIITIYDRLALISLTENQQSDEI